ncbi:MAG: hypothetical protein WBF53_05170 [Litorimonas sp.]
MTHDQTLRAVSLSVLATALSAAPALSQDVVGRNAAVKGDVTIQSIDEAVRAAVLRDDVRLGDDIEARVESSLQVLLLDETVFTVGPSAQVVIDRFVYDPATDNNRMSAQVKQGMFRFMSGNISRQAPDAVEIGTPTASLGIRGTIVEGLVGLDAVDFARSAGLIDPAIPVDADGATIFVLRGPGSRRIGNARRGRIDVTTTAGSVSLDRPGRAAFVQNANAVPVLFDLDADGFAFFSDRLRTVPTAPNSYSPFEIEPRLPDGTPPMAEPDDEYDPLIELDWPETDPDFFDQPCGPSECEDDVFEQ